MKYYGIVDKLKDDHRTGIYGRRSLTENEINAFSRWISIKNTILPLANRIAIDFIGVDILKAIDKKDKIELKGELQDLERKIVIDNNILKNDYIIDEDLGLFYGLFDEFNYKNDVFRRIMKSKGGSSLIIVERSSLPKSMHFGGEYGRFNYGLYCCHPKDENQLIPMENTNELIKNLILEETIRAYEALGAKRIVIEDKTQVKAKVGGFFKGGKADVNQNFEKNILREKTFGKGTFDPNRALKDSLFIHDIPSIMSTLKARISGNQTLEKFTENVNLGVGLDLEVLKMFKANVDFQYMRKWSFEVEFYDKTEIVNLN